MTEDAQPQAPAEKPKKKRGFFRTLFRWIFRLILLLIILVAIAAALVYRVPQKMGIVKSAAEKHLSKTPDRAGAQALLSEARSKGLSTQGVELYVIPYNDYEESVAVAILNAGEGFQFSQGGSLGAVANTFVQIAGGAKANELGVERVALTYVSDSGEDLMSFAAPRDSILTFAQGGMSEEQFMHSIDGDINLPAIIEEQIESLNRMFQ